MSQEHLFLGYTPAFGVQYGADAQRDLNLWAAVFKQGIVDYVEAIRFERIGNRGRRTQISDERQNAIDWFECNDDAVGSFSWLCDLFRQDPGRVRGYVNSNWETLHAGKPRKVQGDGSAPSGEAGEQVGQRISESIEELEEACG